MQDKKKGRMPSAPIKAPTGNIKGIGKKGLFTGGVLPTQWSPKAGGPQTGAQAVALFMRGYQN